MQGGEGDTREPAGDAPLHAAEGQGPDQPDQAPPQREIRLVAAAVHADPLALYDLQLGLDREDEHLKVGQGVPAVAVAAAVECGRRRAQADRRCWECWCKASAQHGEREPRLRPIRQDGSSAQSYFAYSFL